MKKRRGDEVREDFPQKAFKYNSTFPNKRVLVFVLKSRASGLVGPLLTQSLLNISRLRRAAHGTIHVLH